MKSAHCKIIPRRLETRLWQLFDIRPGEARQVVLMAALLFLLLAANNVIKIVRDALFLSRFPITELPYVYLLAAVVAGGGIATYARYTAQLAFSRIVLGSLAFTIASAIGFWFLVVFLAAGWVFYAYYIWSAIAGLVLVAQFWMVANGLFNPRDGKRLFGIVTAGGTIGATVGGLAANWLVRTLLGSAHLLWLVAALLAGALALTAWILGERNRAVLPAPNNHAAASQALEAEDGILKTALGSAHLRTIAALIFVSVVVSTLIDYQFKAAAKGAYPTADALAQFFGSYYAWLGAVTLVAQLWLTGKLLVGFGLTPSLVFLPCTLLAGSFGLLLWPGLAAATATRMAEATLRTSVHQSGMQILFLPVGDAIKKKAKVFLDVTVERLGDGVAALIILSCSLLASASEASLSYVSIAIMLGWIALAARARTGYVEALRRSLACREGFAPARGDFAPLGAAEPAPAAVRQAMEAAAHGRYPEVIHDLIARLGANTSTAAAREALAQYGEAAVKPLRNSLFDARVPRAIRLNIPRTLSKIPAQAAMNALMGGLLEEDRALRFKAILAAEEMSRRFADLKIDRDVVESAVMSDAQLYCRRLVLYATLFEHAQDSAAAQNSLLYHALRDSIDRVLERVMWLLALIYPATDIRRAWAGLNSTDRLRRAHATEFIDNLLTGDIKKYMLPLYSDAPPEQKLRAAFDALGMDALDRDAALRALLAQEDRWLRAAALWEIGLRKPSGFGRAVAQLTKSEDALVRETAALVAQGQVAP